MSTVRRSPGFYLSRSKEHASHVLGLVAFVLWAVAVTHANGLNMNSYGLVSVLGWPFFLGLLLIVAALANELFRTRLRPAHLTVLIAAFVLFVFGTAPAIEPVAGLDPSFVHAGFTQYILVHGHSRQVQGVSATPGESTLMD